MRKAFVLLTATLLATGCATERPPPAATHTFTLTGVTPETPPPAAPRRSNQVIRVDAVSAPASLQGRRMCYRLDYYDPGEMAYYSESQWSTPVPAMVGQVVQDALTRYGGWKAVVGPNDDASAAANINIHLLNLCQEFSAPKRSSGALAARVTVTDAATGKVIAQRELEYRVPAPTADAAGGVDAERKAIRKLGLTVSQWVAGLKL